MLKDSSKKEKQKLSKTSFFFFELLIERGAVKTSFHLFSSAQTPLNQLKLLWVCTSFNFLKVFLVFFKLLSSSFEETKASTGATYLTETN